jgi:hypothetical protein
LIGRLAVCLIAQLPQVVHQRFQRAGIVGDRQPASDGVNRGLLAGIVG